MIIPPLFTVHKSLITPKASGTILLATWNGRGKVRQVSGSEQEIVSAAQAFSDETGDPVIIGTVTGQNGDRLVVKKTGLIMVKKADPLSDEAFTDWDDSLSAELDRIALEAFENLGVLGALAAALDFDYAAEAGRIAELGTGFRRAVSGAVEAMIPPQQRAMVSQVAQTIRQVGRAMARTEGIRGTIGARLSLPGREIGQLMTQHHGFFVRDQFGRINADMARRASEIIRVGLEQGLGRTEMQKDLLAVITDGYRMKGYWQVVSANAIAHARSYSQGSSMLRAGIEAVRIIAVLDIRTCFFGDTRVTMADGSERQIKDVAVGDTVVSSMGNPRKVTSKQISPKKVWIKICLSDGREIITTPNHPFLTKVGWVRAAHIRKCDKLATNASDLCTLWETVSEEEKSRKVLLGGMQEGSKDVQALRENRNGSENIHRKGAIPVLLSSMQNRCQEKRGSCGVTESNMRNVREGIFFYPELTEAWSKTEALLKEMQSEKNGCQLHSVRQEISTKNNGSEILFYIVLPKSWGGDEHRNNSKEKLGGSRSSIRAGETYPPMVCRLPGRRNDSNRGRRNILAQHPEDSRERQEERCCAGQNGSYCDSYSGGKGEDRTELRDQRIRGLWPQAKDNIADTARFIDVEDVFVLVYEENIDAYDITIDRDAGYIANGLVVHNTDWCLYLHDKIVPLGSAMAQMDRAMNAATPEGLMDAHPLARTRGDRVYFEYTDGRQVDLMRIVEPGRDGNPGTYVPAFPASQLVDAAVGLPPYHHACRSTFVSV